MHMDTGIADGVTVTGIGKAGARPDVMSLDLGAEANSPGVQEALERASAALDRMRVALREAGVPDADISSGDVTVWPSHDDRQQVTGYTATLRLGALLRDLGTAGSIVSRTIGAGGDAARVFGMSLRHADPASLLGQARDAAWRDAQAKAEQYAGLAGRSLGPVHAVRESAADWPQPGRAYAADVSLAGGMPVEPGSATVTVSVDVRWELA